MKDEVIIVQRALDLKKAVKSICINEVISVDIDREFFEEEELIHIKDMEYMVDLGEFQINFLKIENYNWYVLLFITEKNGERYYPEITAFLFYLIEGRCGSHTIYIQKEGSKTKIDEE